MARRVLHARARAKLNLSLNVTGKRGDGYHLLHSIITFCDVADVITVRDAPNLSVTMEGPFAFGITERDNLVTKAATLLHRVLPEPKGAAITLDKQLPHASGIGGGSSDAATTLRLLNELWHAGFDDAALAKLAAPLGADMAMCLHGRACIAEGVGDIIHPLPPQTVAGLHALLVNPLVPVSTPAVFAQLVRKHYVDHAQGAAICDDQQLTAQQLQAMRNDLQGAACNVAPVIEDVLSTLRTICQEAITIRMSGSGATCFAIFNSAEACEVAARVVANMQPEWWIARGALQ